MRCKFRQVGKPLKDARLEIARAVAALHLAAEEATRICGEVVPMDAVPGGEGRIAYTIRRPLGVIVGITGFNFPLLLDCHKIAPALGRGQRHCAETCTRNPHYRVGAGRGLRRSRYPSWRAECITRGRRYR